MIGFERFPIGFWCYYPPGFEWNEKEVLEWKECGITLTISPFFDPEKTDKAQFKKMVDFCYENGISLIINDARGNLGAYTKDPDGYREVYLSAVEEWKDHKGVVGFFIGDEPYGATIVPCAEICRIQLELAPNYLPYMNFFPYEVLSREGEATEFKSFTNYMRDFEKMSACPAYSYDCYTQMNPEPEYINDFYNNLYNFKRMAKEKDKFLFSINLSVGHFRYRVPNVDALRWQFYGSIACGANGVLWFTYYTPVRRSNYRGGPIDEWGNKTETYYAMQRIHKKFHRDYADILKNAKHLDTQCINKRYSGYMFFSANFDVCKELGIMGYSTDCGTPGLVSFFEDEKGEKFAMMFNNSYDKCDLFKFTLRPEVKKVWMLFNGEKVDFEKDHPDEIFWRSENGVEVAVHLAPGEIRLFKLEY